MPAANDTIIPAQADTLASDTLPDPAAMHIAMTRPRGEAPRGTYIPDTAAGASWIILGLVTLFVLIAWRFHGSMRFVGPLVKELREGPGRKTMFDDTMHETAFMTMLNLLSVASGAVILWQITGCFFSPQALAPAVMLHNIGVCAALASTLYLGRRVLCRAIGLIFATPELTRGWMRAYTASTGLMAFVFFPLGLAGMFYPSGLELMLAPSLAAYALGRLLFIIKGFRIFSVGKEGYIGFLYYLCSVEIIPVVITCGAATHLCRP